MIFKSQKNSRIQPFAVSPFFIKYLWWLLPNSNLIFVTQILTKTKRSYFYILILAMQTKQINIFSYIINIKENLKNTDEKKCCFKHQQNHISWSNRGNYVGKTCSQKFHLHVPFITHLNTFAHVWVCACAITCFSWKGLYRVRKQKGIIKTTRFSNFSKMFWFYKIKKILSLTKKSNHIFFRIPKNNIPNAP